LAKVLRHRPDSERMLESAMNRLGLSARAHDRIRKVAHTIADLEGAENILNARSVEAAVSDRRLEFVHFYPWSKLAGYELVTTPAPSR
jgi:predicted ATPase with chaperone activity